jgi:hypothetical protein
MRDPIHDIVQRLALIEGRITPAEPAGDQNSQQKSAHQLPALFKPGKGGPILGGNPDKPAVTKGYFFGAEAEEKEEEALEEAQANEEKLLDKVKRSFADYLSSIEDQVKGDSDIKDKVKGDSDIKDKVKKDRDLVAKAKEIAEDPTDQAPATDMPTPAIQEPTYAAATVAPVKTITLEDGRVCEIHGDENSGFEIRHGNRRLPSRFKNLNHATLAMEMFMSRRKQNDASADYIEEA